MNITKDELKNFYINYHFDGLYDLEECEAVAGIFNRIQTVQFDPLNVVGRNAELVLFSRNSNVTRKSLFDALYTGRTLVDGWDKMMSIFPTRYFPHFKRVREFMAENYKLTMAWRNQLDCLSHVEKIYSYIENNGPVLVSDIPSGKTNDGNWGPTKIAGVCCEYLYLSGKISVAYKKGVVKAYDITERLLGKITDENVFADEEEFLSWYVKRRIAATGAIWDKNGGAWLGPFIEKGENRTQIIAKLCEKGEIFPVEVESEKTPFYVCREAKSFIGKPAERRARILAPLDNMIWDRKLIKNVFGFDYSWEVYVPAAKRKFGYYVLPVIIGNAFACRIEPVQYKPGEKLTIKNVWYEPDYKRKDGDVELLAAELARLARFLDVEIDNNIKDKLI